MSNVDQVAGRQSSHTWCRGEWAIAMHQAISGTTTNACLPVGVMFYAVQLRQTSREQLLLLLLLLLPMQLLVP